MIKTIIITDAKEDAAKLRDSGISISYQLIRKVASIMDDVLERGEGRLDAAVVLDQAPVLLAIGGAHALIDQLVDIGAPHVPVEVLEHQPTEVLGLRQE